MRRARSLGKATSLVSPCPRIYLNLDAFLSDAFFSDEEFRRQRERAASVRAAFAEALLGLTRIRPIPYGRLHHLDPADYLDRFALVKPNHFTLAKPKPQRINYLTVAIEATRVSARGLARVRSYRSHLNQGGPSRIDGSGISGNPEKKKKRTCPIHTMREGERLLI